MNKLFYLFCSVTIALSFSACAPSYVATEPASAAVERPPNPGNKHVWVDGNWVWSNRTHSYVWRNGYWATPHRGRAYVPGYWQSNHHGHYWVHGRWN